MREAIVETLKVFPVVDDLKPNRKLILEHVVRRKDVFAALPIRFGQSLAFQILPSV